MKNMKSNWENTKVRSKYHFDPTKMDPNYDTVVKLGRIVANYSVDVEAAVSDSKPATWRTRGQAGKYRPEEELAAEDYDLERFGYGKDYQITHCGWRYRIWQRSAVKKCISRSRNCDPR